jgi:hypothetical protein
MPDFGNESNKALYLASRQLPPLRPRHEWRRSHYHVQMLRTRTWVYVYYDFT